MFFTKLRRVIKSGFINFWRNGVVSLSAILVLVVTLFVIGSLVFAQAILTSTLDHIKDKVDINVYFKLDASEREVLGLKSFLETEPEVLSVQYTSREAALKAFQERHKDNSTILGAIDEVGQNPLGASLTVKAKDPSQYEAIATMLQGNDSTALSASKGAINTQIIDEVTYFKNKVVIDRLSKVIDSTQKMGFAVAIVLSFIAILVTFNTIRLVIYTAREEIAVMKLVGASNNYVRGPFVVEGVMFGMIAAVLVMALFFAGTAWAAPATENFFGGLNLYSYYMKHFVEVFGLMLGIGTILAAVSSYLAVWRYLRV